jgi:hypothetical protein
MKTSLSACAFALICLSAPFSTVAAFRYVNVKSPNPTSPYTNWATAATVIQDAVDAALPGDEVVVTNGVYQTGGRAVDGFLTNRVVVTKPVTLRSVNGPEVTVIRGHQVPGTTNGEAAVRCAYLTDRTALLGFTLTNGATALHSGLTWPRADYGGAVYCEPGAVVSNCVLVGNTALTLGGAAYGGTLKDCTLDSNTAWAGGGAGLATLNHCTFMSNRAERGGGAYYGTLNNCTLVGNRATSGGGAFLGWLTNCLVTGNSAGAEGGGIAGALLINCAVVCNSAARGGGASSTSICDWDCLPFWSHLYNCIVYHNNADEGVNYWGDTFFDYSCTSSMPTNGLGNITNAPIFVDATAGNFWLQSNSPCINAGRNADAPAGLDLDGNPRIAGGTVDMGAYEFQSPQSTLSYAWLQQYGLPADGLADFADTDGDGHNNWQEWRARTDPTDSASALRLLAPTVGANGLLIRWQSLGGQKYVLERSTNLVADAAFVPFASNILGQAGTTVFTDTNALGAGPSFYRVGVNE